MVVYRYNLSVVLNVFIFLRLVIFSSLLRNSMIYFTDDGAFIRCLQRGDNGVTKLLAECSNDGSVGSLWRFNPSKLTSAGESLLGHALAVAYAATVQADCLHAMLTMHHNNLVKEKAMITVKIFYATRVNTGEDDGVERRVYRTKHEAVKCVDEWGEGDVFRLDISGDKVNDVVLAAAQAMVSKLRDGNVRFSQRYSVKQEPAETEVKRLTPEQYQALADKRDRLMAEIEAMKNPVLASDTLDQIFTDRSTDSETTREFLSTRDDNITTADVKREPPEPF